jgi:hypothetical protein
MPSPRKISPKVGFAAPGVPKQVKLKSGGYLYMKILPNGRVFMTKIARKRKT